MSDPSNYLDPSQNADPFSSGASAAPSNDIWKNLMAFGAATSAAGAKGGATFAGSLGQGIQAAMQNARDNANARSEQSLKHAQSGYYGSETQAKQIANAQAMFQLQRQNMINQSYGLPAMQMPNIPGYGQMQSVQTAQTGAPPTQAGQATDNSQSIAPSAPSSTQQSGNTPQESQGMTGAVWGSTPATSTTQPPQTNVYPRDAAFTPPGNNAAALGAYRQQNGLQTPPIDAQRGSVGLPVGESSNLPLPSGGNVQMALPNSPQMQAAAQQVAQQAGATGNVQQQQQMTNRQIAQMLLSPNSSQMMSQINDPQTAQRLVKAGQDLNLPVPPFITELANAPAKAMTQTVDARQGGVSTNEASGVTAIGRLEGMSPEGAKYITPPQVMKNGVSMLAPPEDAKQSPTDTKWPIAEKNPEHPWQIPAGGTMTGVPDWLDQWREKNYPAMANLQTQMQQQAGIDDAIGALKNSSELQPGPWAEQRKALADSWNTFLRASGHPDEANEKASASAAEFVKLAQQSTNTAAHDISSRGTNFDIVSASRANPQYTMPYMSALITNSMNSEAVARNYNRIMYIDDRTKEGISEAQATKEFEDQQPGDMVVKRAESIVAPIQVKTPGGFSQLLPGTKYELPNGKQGYVPVPKDYPFQIPYTNPVIKARRAGEQQPQAGAPQ